MGDADEPLSDLARRVERRRAERSAADAADDAPATSPFESMAVESVDPETLWAALADDDPAAGITDRAEAVGGASGGLEHVVPKRTFCQACPHFAAPPAFACTRAGTELVEVVDPDRFRVRNCPVVREGDPDERRERRPRDEACDLSARSG